MGLKRNQNEYKRYYKINHKCMYKMNYIWYIKLVKKQQVRLQIDSGNEKKLQKHGVSLVDIEKFFKTNPSYRKDIVHSVNEPRYIAFGPYKDYFLFVSFTPRDVDGKVYLRPISARKAREREIKRLYEESNK